MFKILFVVVSISAAVLAVTNLETGTTKILAKSGFTSYPNPVKGADILAIPPDQGGNYHNYDLSKDYHHDNLWKDRNPIDFLITREIEINPTAIYEQSFTWNAAFPGKQITHIRFLNIGRERAWVESITSSGDATASAVIRVAPYHQFRLLVEVYGI